MEIENIKTPLSGTIDSRIFKKLVHGGKIRLAGNKKLKIYGKLNCTPGKRMKKTNRVLFSSEEEALRSGYRPCGHCLREKYLLWKGCMAPSLPGSLEGTWFR